MDAVEQPEAPFNFIYNYVEKDTLHKYLRLTIIVCFYVFARTYYSNYAKTREIARKLEEDKKERETRSERDRAKVEDEMNKLDEEARSFGWGKTTRRNVKRQTRELESRVEELREYHQGTYDAAEDHDIDDLLE